jgi:hypothetical protein
MQNTIQKLIDDLCMTVANNAGISSADDLPEELERRLDEIKEKKQAVITAIEIDRQYPSWV